MADTAQRDPNYVPYQFVSMTAVNGVHVPTNVYVDETTHRLLVNAVISGGGSSGTQYAEGATTTPATGTLALARYQVTPPSLTDGQMWEPQLDSSGNLKVTGSLSVGGTTDNSAFTAGTSTGTPAMGFYHTTIDSVTDNRSAAFAMTVKRAMHSNLRDNAGAELVGQKAMAASVPVVISSDQATFPVTAAATLAAETTKVIGVVRTADGAGNLYTTNSTTYTAKFGQDTNLLGTLGTAFSTAGKVDIKGADGDVFVRNATAANFLANVTLQTQTDTVMIGGVNIKEINAVTPLMGNGGTGTGSQRVTIASDNTPFPVKLDQTTPGTTNAVSIAQIGATTILNGGVAGSQSIGGTVATNVAINANPLNLGAQAVSSENSAVTTARQVQLVADLVGKLIVLPYANPENFVSFAMTSAMTGTTSTITLAAPAAGLRNYITQITVSNSHATVGTDILIQDGNGGTTIYVIPAAPAFGGATLTFPTPLRQPTTATAIYVANVTTGSNTKVSLSGYKGA